MKIANVNVHYQDGLGYQDYYLGLEFKRANHDIQFISSDWHFNYPDYENTVKHIIGDQYVGTGIYENEYGVKIHRLKGKWRWTGFIWLEGFKEKLVELNPDLIISHGILTWQTIRLIFLAKHLNCPIIFDDHTHPEILRKGFVAEVFFFIFRTLFGKGIYRTGEKIVGITDGSTQVIEEKFGIKGDKVKMIPLGTDANVFYKDSEKRKKYRAYLEVEEDEYVILYTGKIYHHKYAHLLIDALNDPDVTQDKKIIIHFVGDIASDYQSLLDEKMNSSKNKVIYRKAVSQKELPEIYNGADIAVWPASATNSTIDASACGCPIICVKALKERIENNNGIGVNPADLVDLKKALKRMLSDDSLLREMGINGIKLVEEKLSWKAVARQFLAGLSS